MPDLSAPWRKRAACVGSDPLFDDTIDGESVSGRKARMVRAAIVCVRCPVRDECLADVDLIRDGGVRAGFVITVGRSGARLVPVRTWLATPHPVRDPSGAASSRRLPREHGTDRGYYQHRHRGDMPACFPCQEAHSERQRELAQRAKKAS